MPSAIILVYKLLKDSEHLLKWFVGRRTGHSNKTCAVSSMAWHRNQVKYNSYVLTLVYIIIWCIKAIYRLYKHYSNRLYRHTNALQDKKRHKNLRVKLQNQGQQFIKIPRDVLQRKPELGGYDVIGKNRWKNSYPIVLVHGYMGWGPDESPILGDYWKSASDARLHKQFEGLELYQADIGPIGCIHDRACELYQQLVGIVHIREQFGLSETECGPEMAKAVYGEDHFNEEHSQFQQFYSPKYLKQIKTDIGSKMYAFPCGLPGGWSSERKIHIVAHSQGAPTVRYLQYLLSIDYFNPNKKGDFNQRQKLVDKSDYIASISMLSGCNNGTCLPNQLWFDKKDNMVQTYKKQKTLTAAIGSGLYQAAVWGVIAKNYFCAPLFQFKKPGSLTGDSESEIKLKIIKTGVYYTPHTSTSSSPIPPTPLRKQEYIYEISNQNGLIMNLNLETTGLHWQKTDKDFTSYVKRVQNNNFLFNSTHHATPEFNYPMFQDINDKCQVFPHTFYFSYTTAESKVRQCSSKNDKFKELPKFSERGLGFDSNADQNLQMIGQSSKNQRLEEEKVNQWDLWVLIAKMHSPISIYVKFCVENELPHMPKHFDNLFNPNMNDVQSLDYSMYDHMSTDGVLARYNQEYPKYATSVTDKTKTAKIWGTKSDPLYFDLWQDARMQSYKKGVWYYSGLPKSTHNDLPGHVNPFEHAEIATQNEYRPQFWINLINRVYQLDFTEGSTVREKKIDSDASQDEDEFEATIRSL